MHFPLHKGIEALLAFIGGDVDRPIIAASVPNPETKTPITGANQTRCQIKSGGGNEFHYEDKKGSQCIRLFSPTDKTSYRLGAPDADGKPSGIKIFTGGEEDKEVKKHRKFVIGQKENKKVIDDRELLVKKKETIKIDNGQLVEIKNKRDLKILSGGDKIVITGGQKVEVTGKQDITVTGNQSVKITAGQKVDVTASGAALTVIGGRKVTVTGMDEVKCNSGRTLTITGADNYTVNGARTITVNGKETRSVSAIDNFYQGMKQNHQLAFALENYFGAKLEIRNSVDIALKQTSIGMCNFKCEFDVITLEKGKFEVGGTLKTWLNALDIKV